MKKALFKKGAVEGSSHDKGNAMTQKTVRLLGGAIALLALIPASGPLLLGIVRDDIHAHSRVGDLGLQAITLSGILLFGAGILLLAKGGNRSSGTES